jgi:restriction endonuclease Mrr
MTNLVNGYGAITAPSQKYELIEDGPDGNLALADRRRDFIEHEGGEANREVVQAKRHERTIQRKNLDELRGSLYRFNAVRGTIIATSRFLKGTEEAAIAGAAAPITLIDGDKLIDLLIEHGIGVRKRTLEVLAVDPDVFADLEGEA